MTSPKKDLAGSEDIGGRPVEGGPVHVEAEVAFALGGEAADGGAVEGEVVIALDKELLVVIEHMETAFEVAEQDGDGLDPLFVGQVLEAVLLDLSGVDAVLPLFLGVQVEFLEFRVGKHEKVLQ
jgi:hypothetical protein